MKSLPPLLRSLYLLLVLLPAVFSSGCKSTEEPEDLGPDTIKVTSKVRVAGTQKSGLNIRRPDAPPDLDLTRLKETTFTGAGGGQYPANAAGDAQRRAVATATARREALRVLAYEISRFPLTDTGPSISARVAQDEGGTQLLEDILESSSSVEMEYGIEDVKAEASLSGATIAEAYPFNSPFAEIDPGDDEIPISEDDDRPLTERRAEAEERALTRARNAIRDELLKIETNFGAMTEILHTNPEAREDFDEMIEAIPARQVEFTDDGLCILTATFNRNRAYDFILANKLER